MAKKPGTRHSRSTRKPVTIDLSEDDVKRVDTEKGAAAPAKEAAEAEKAKATAKSTAKTAETQSGLDDKKAEKPDAARKTAATPGSASGKKPDKAPASDNASLAATSDARRDPPKPSGIGMVASAFLGAVIALAGAGGAYYAGFLPGATSGSDAVTAEISRLESEITALRGQIPAASDGTLETQLEATEGKVDTLSAAVDGLRTDLGTLNDTVSGGGASEGAGLSAIDTRVKALESQVQAISTADPASSASAESVEALDTRLKGLDDRIGAMEATLTQMQSQMSAVAALPDRVEQLDGEVKSLAGEVSEGKGQENVARTIAASALKSAIDRGVPFMSELETFASVTGGDSSAVTALRSMAATGVPTRGQITDEAGDAAYAMIGASEAPAGDTNLAERLLSSARSLVKVRPKGAVEGDSVAAITARMEASVQQGAYGDALKEYDALPDAAKAAGASFAAKIRARMEADKLVDTVLSGALTGTAGTATETTQ